MKYKIATRSAPHDEKSCYLCALASEHAVDVKKKQKAKAKTDDNLKLCDKGLTPVGRGINHKCTSLTLRENLANVVKKPVQEQFATKGISCLSLLACYL